MKTLLEFLNGLDPVDRSGFADRCGTTVGYLRKAVSAGQRISAETCINIERESCGAVMCETLRPDVDWGVVRKSSSVDSEPKHTQALTQQAQVATETVAKGVAHA